MQSVAEIVDALNPERQAKINRHFDELRTALEKAREYIDLDARNKKYPLAVETLAVIDAALTDTA